MSQAFTMSDNSSRQPAAAPSVVAALLPIIGVVFIAFLVIGLALPVVPLHVHQGLGLGTFVVGLVAGAQFAASLLSRFWAGHFADSRGAKRATVTGLLVAAVAGLLYLLSLLFVSEPVTSVTILLLGRAVLGGAESFIVTGAFTWGLALVGPQCTPPSRSARRLAPACTPPAASRRSRSQRH
jgi:MFS family permease